MENMTYPLEGIGLVDVVDVDGMTWRPLTYPRPFSIDFSWKIGCKTCVIYVFENMTYPLVGLGLVDVFDVDGHDFDAVNISETTQSISLENWV